MKSKRGILPVRMKAVIKYFGRMLGFILLLLVGAVIFQYLTCPVYRFPEPKPFSGDLIFNPYKGMDSTVWRRANFQVQSHVWGGITDGRKNTNEIIDSIYRELDYDIIATSDYQKINYWGQEKKSYIPVYEHGYGIFKNHQVLLGSKKVNWADFPVYQNLNHKQHIINILRKNNELIYIAHPGLRGAYEPEDMKYLTGYEGLEVLNYVIVSKAHWDSALSAGHYVTIMGNDDSHDVSQPLEVGHRCTYINSPSLDGDSIMAALRTGRAFGADIFRTPDETIAEKAVKAKQIARLDYVQLAGDTLKVGVSKAASTFKFIGQDGVVKSETEGGSSASYVIRPEDTYIRTEIIFPDKNVFYLNPVIRFDGTTPSNPDLATIDWTRSWIFWILGWSTLAFILFNIFYIPRRLKRSNFSWRVFFSESRYKKYLFILILISLVLKVVVASSLELGNDEVYYWTYALFPDWSHFDHPPMVGWIIQLFTLNLTFEGEFFMRLPGIVLGIFNLILVFSIGKFLKDEATGWYAALLYTASIYCFIISGTFILPDTPQMFFWLLAVFLFIRSLPLGPVDASAKNRLLLAGIASGLAMLSKYTSVFLWVGAALFILIYRRVWLRQVHLYLSLLFSLILFIPVIIWNVNNDFISFTFQGSRAGFFSGGVNPVYFLTELGGEILYNNPVVFLVILVSVIAFFRGKSSFYGGKVENLILLWSLPLILLFLFLSLFRPTLPHWTGPAYTTLIFMAAAYLRQLDEVKGRKGTFPLLPTLAAGLMFLFLTAGVLQVNYGLFYTDKEKSITELGKHDVSLDMYGWDQVRREFMWLASDDLSRGVMPAGAPIVTFRWFPAANLDYYIAHRTGRAVLALGDLGSIHKYYWINQARGGFKKGMDAYYITTSRDFKDPNEVYSDDFKEISKPYFFPIKRGGKVAEYGFIFQLKGYGMSSGMSSQMNP